MEFVVRENPRDCPQMNPRVCVDSSVVVLGGGGGGGGFD